MTLSGIAQIGLSSVSALSSLNDFVIVQTRGKEDSNHDEADAAVVPEQRGRMMRVAYLYCLEDACA